MQRGAKPHVIINQAQPSRRLANAAPPRPGPLRVRRRGCAQTAVSRKAERGTQEAGAQLAGQQLQEDTVTHRHWPVRKPSGSYSGRIRSRSMRSKSVLDGYPRSQRVPVMRRAPVRRLRGASSAARTWRPRTRESTGGDLSACTPSPAGAPRCYRRASGRARLCTARARSSPNAPSTQRLTSA